MNWTIPWNEALELKRYAHATVLARLRTLAELLELPDGSFELRSNLGGSACSGEITLHQDTFYLSVSQPRYFRDKEILIRTCAGRHDAIGDRNSFAPLAMLDDLDGLAACVRRVTGARSGTETADREGEGGEV